MFSIIYERHSEIILTYKLSKIPLCKAVNLVNFEKISLGKLHI